MSEHSYPLEVDAASEAHKMTYTGTMRNIRTAIMVCIFSMLSVVFVFAGSSGAVAVGTIAAMGAFVFLGGRLITAFVWALGAIVLFIVIALVKGLIVG